MVGVEAGGMGLTSGKHAARFAGGVPGVLHGTMTYLLQDRHGQISGTHSVSAGLDYAAVGPEHAMHHDSGRIQYTSATDQEAWTPSTSCLKRKGLFLPWKARMR